MKRFFGMVSMSILLIFAACQQNNSSESGKVSLKTKADSMNYSLGVEIGKNLKPIAEDIETNVVRQGMEDALKDRGKLLSDEEVQKGYKDMQEKMTTKMQAERAAKAEKNKAEGEAFLAENKKKEGVVTLPSGLQYKVIKQGNGPKPKANDVVVAHYRGRLVDGTQFDSSYDRG
ncbi:MAG: hypothetical protein D6732_17340, partial [Methanobacteriota archaeon]